MTVQATRIVIKPQALQAKPGSWTSQITNKDSTEKAETALLQDQDIRGKQSHFAMILVHHLQLLCSFY